LKECFGSRELERGAKLSPVSEGYFRKLYKNSRRKRGEDNASSTQRVVRLRDEKVGVPDRYVDAFCGRVGPRNLTCCASCLKLPGCHERSSLNPSEAWML
jgi:hypothetical protein